VSRSRAHFPWPATKLGAELKKLRHSARSHRPWSAPRDQGLTGTLASNGGKQRRLRRSADRPALRPVRNASGEHLPLLRRTAIGWRGCCFVSQPRYAQRTRRSRRERMVSSPSMRLKNAIGKTNPIQRLVPLEPNPDHHRTNDSPAIELTAGRSVRERARARSRSARDPENPPLEVGPTQTPVGSTAPLCSALRRFFRALSKIRKRPGEIFHAIGPKGVVRGQSRQPLMSWRLIRCGYIKLYITSSGSLRRSSAELAVSW
jgi:hypothetical protein